MTRPVKHYDWEIKVSFTVSQIQTRRSSDGRREWMQGNVATKHGLVGVLTDPPRIREDGTLLRSGDKGTSNFRFIYGGRLYIRMYKKVFTKLGLARKAREFAEYIAASKGSS